MMQAYVEVTDGPLVGTKAELQSDKPLLIGRLAECDVAFPTDMTVSRRHCRIELHPSHCLLANLSSNGTLVNGNRVDEVSLTDGDEIRVSQGTTLRIHVVAPEPVSMPDPQPEASSATEDAFRETVPIPANFGETTFHADDFSRQPVIDPDRLLSPCSVVVVSGPLAGRTMDLQEGRPLLIGRLPECDLSIQYDPAMSRRQCQLAFVPPDCFLTNISVNGSFVNDHRVDGEAKLTDGDEIEIGSNTILRVHIHETAQQSVVGAAAIPGSNGVIQLGRRECASGLVLLTSQAETDVIPLPFVRQLSRLGPVCAVVDFAKAGVALPEDLAKPNHVFDWMPAEAAAQVSPVILSPTDSASFSSIVDEAWGTDALVLLFSSRPATELHGHLRALASYNPATGRQTPGQSLFAYWWPSLIGSMLVHSSAELVLHITEGVDAILLEDTQSDRWRLLAKPEFVQQVQELESVEVLAMTT